MVRKGEQVTINRYNKVGLLIEKRSTSGSFAELKYHDTLNKISKVTNVNATISYSYNTEGSLTEAKTVDGKSIRIAYDEIGLIKHLSMTDGEEQKNMSYTYDGMGKPVTINLLGVGVLSVSYDVFGDIDEINSSDAEELSRQISDVFNDVMDIVQPAGISL